MKTFNHDFVTLPKLHRVTADDGKRYYVTPDGNAYQSVTTLTGKVNEKAIKAWREKVGEEEATKISTRAANRGTSMHKLCEKYLLNKIEADPLGRILLEDVNPRELSRKLVVSENVVVVQQRLVLTGPRS